MVVTFIDYHDSFIMGLFSREIYIYEVNDIYFETFLD